MIETAVEVSSLFTTGETRTESTFLKLLSLHIKDKVSKFIFDYLRT